MFELELLPTLLIFLAGFIVGIAALMINNKLSGGSVSASKIKKEKDDYQVEVEAHFEETSKKFKQMAAQYQDLYQHMSVGATTLCRPENIAPGLTDQTDPLASRPQPSKSEPPKPEPSTSKPTKPEPALQARNKKKGSQKDNNPMSKKTESSESVKSNNTKITHSAKSDTSKPANKRADSNKTSTKNRSK